MMTNSVWTVRAMVGALALGAGAPAWAQPGAYTEEEVAPGVMQPAAPSVGVEAVEDNFSGSIGVDVASHFVSYGADVWGGGDDFFGDESTMFVWGDFNLALPHFNLNFGVWSDINGNVDSEIGGDIQEIDVYVGVNKDFGRFNVGATYQEWYYASDEERIVDLGVAFDDSDLLFDGFALNPGFVAHFRVDGNGGQEEGEAFVFSIEPSFEVVKSEDYPVTLSIPASVGFFSDEFHGGDSGFGYASVGATVGVPLAFIPEGYGQWGASANVTYYLTEEDVIPGNAEEDFLTGMLSLSVSF